MRTLTIITVLFIFTSCKPNLDKKSESEQVEKEIKNVFDRSILFPFGFELSEFEKDGVNEYRDGDCSGKIEQFSKDKYKIAIDSTNCGEYGIQYKFYLIENNNLKLVHIKELKPEYQDKPRGIKYIANETVFDYRAAPFILYSRISVLDKPDFELMTSGLLKTEFDDFENRYNLLKTDYENSWKMRLD